MLRNIIILFAIVAAALYFLPGGWFTTTDQREMEQIAAATDMMMPSSIGVNIGLAAGLAERCGYRLDESSVERAANLNGLRPEMLQPGGVSRHLWAEGYQQGLASPRSESLCNGAIEMFGASGNRIPHLLRR